MWQNYTKTRNKYEINTNVSLSQGFPKIIK